MYKQSQTAHTQKPKRVFVKGQESGISEQQLHVNLIIVT